MLPLLLPAAAAVAPSTSSYKSVMQWAQKYTQKSLMSRLRLGCCYAMSQMKISRFSSLLFVLFPSSSYCLPKIHLSLGKNEERGGTPAWSRKVIFLTLEGESLGNVFPHSTSTGCPSKFWIVTKNHLAQFTIHITFLRVEILRGYPVYWPLLQRSCWEKCSQIFSDLFSS